MVDDDRLLTPAPPPNVLPGMTETSVLLHAEGGRSVGLTGVAVYPQGFVFELWLFQPPTGRHRGYAVEPAVVGLRFADGRFASVTVPAGPRPPGTDPARQRAIELLVRPTAASVVPSGARQQIWVSPLPPPGPVELTLTSADGRLLGAVELAGDDLLAAAGRALEVPVVGSFEPFFDATHAPALPPTGRRPESAREAEAEIRAAFRQVFTADRDGDAFLQDGEVLRGAMQEAAGAWPDVAATLQVGLGEVGFLDEVRAAVQYQLSWSGGGFAPQLGYAVLDGGRWKVARGTYCRLLESAGVQYPPPPPPY